MKRRILTLLCVLAMLLGMFGMAVAAANDQAVAVIGGTGYTSLQAAVNAVKEGAEGLIELKKDTKETISVSCNVYVDLAGNDIAGVNVTAGTFYGMDSATIIEAGDSADVDYGNIAAVSGSVEAISVDDNYSEDSYLKVSETAGTSFHAVNLRLTDMTLRPDAVGLYFKSTFAGDKKVADRVASFGVALSAKAVPTKDNLNTDCALSKFTGFEAGANAVGTSTLLTGIMKPNNPYLTNQRNANALVYGRAYVKLTDGTYIFGAVKSRSLRQQVEAFCRLWDFKGNDEKMAVHALCAKFPYEVAQWEATVAIYFNAVGQAELDAWYAAYNALPIANENMTPEQARQACVDLFRLQLTIPWIGNESFVFRSKTGDLCTLDRGMAHSGMAYNAGGELTGYVDASGAFTSYTTVPYGNLYKMLKFHDPETGMLNIKAMGNYKTVIDTLTTQCHRAASWAWGRVCNSFDFLELRHCNEKQGAIKVGNYTIPESAYTQDPNYSTRSRIDTEVVVDNNTADAIYKSYAQMQPADGLLSSSDVHLMMCAEVKVVYNIPGVPSSGINPTSSCVYIIDQHAYGTIDNYVNSNAGNWNYIVTQSNGAPMRRLGSWQWDDEKQAVAYNFAYLRSQNYIPFTLAEFTGASPIETPDTWLNNYSNSGTPVRRGTISLTTLSAKYLHANYAISHVRYTVKDSSGNVVLTQEPNDDRSIGYVTTHIKKEHLVGNFLDENLLSAYTNGQYTIEIDAFLTTGQYVNAFSGTLVG